MAVFAQRGENNPNCNFAKHAVAIAHLGPRSQTQADPPARGGFGSFMPDPPARGRLGSFRPDPPTKGRFGGFTPDPPARGGLGSIVS